MILTVKSDLDIRDVCSVCGRARHLVSKVKTAGVTEDLRPAFCLPHLIAHAAFFAGPPAIHVARRKVAQEREFARLAKWPGIFFRNIGLDRCLRRGLRIAEVLHFVYFVE